jgi:hypothetical protein
MDFCYPNRWVDEDGEPIRPVHCSLPREEIVRIAAENLWRLPLFEGEPEAPETTECDACDCWLMLTNVDIPCAEHRPPGFVLPG